MSTKDNTDIRDAADILVMQVRQLKGALDGVAAAVRSGDGVVSADLHGLLNIGVVLETVLSCFAAIPEKHGVIITMEEDGVAVLPLNSTMADVQLILRAVANVFVRDVSTTPDKNEPRTVH